MNTKKILALAAVALMAVPAYAAATQIVVPGIQEQVVEGHTVFAVIQKVREREQRVEAAAVAVLVREKEINEFRFNGTLWFNDQFLVSPVNTKNTAVRYPCGGAVLAVNHGDPDPREMLVSFNQVDFVQANHPQESDSDPYDVTRQGGDYELPTAPPTEDTNGEVTDGGAEPDPQAIPAKDTPTPGPSGASQPGPSSWLDAEDPDALTSTSVNGGTNPTLSTATLSSLAYNESYLITDPNDHSWIVDKYDAITVASIDLNAPAATIQTQKFPVWVVNILGKPVFTPDDGITSCSPFVDDPWQQSVVNRAFYTADNQVAGATTGAIQPSRSCPGGMTNDCAPADGVPDSPGAEQPWVGYYEPTQGDMNGDGINDRESYCYEGNAADANYDPSKPSPQYECDHGLTFIPPGPGYRQDPRVGPAGNGAIDVANRNIYHPLRLYNALLYFYLGAGDVRVTSRAAHGLDDTNGCQVGTEWVCPDWVDTDGDGLGDTPGVADDNAEGNSHPFNPPGIWAPTVPDGAGGRVPFTGEHYDQWSLNRDCSLGYQTEPYDHDGNPLTPPVAPTDEHGDPICKLPEHHAHNRGEIDLYFSGTARPMEPAVRVFGEIDTEGRTQAFHENNEPNGRPTPGEHPGHDVDVPPSEVPPNQGHAP